MGDPAIWVYVLLGAAVLFSAVLSGVASRISFKKNIHGDILGVLLLAISVAFLFFAFTGAPHALSQGHFNHRALSVEEYEVVSSAGLDASTFAMHLIPNPRKNDGEHQDIVRSHQVHRDCFLSWDRDPQAGDVFEVRVTRDSRICILLPAQ